MFYGRVFRKVDSKPLEKIAVSDGRNITFTDELGAFSLPGYERTRVIFVSTLTTSHDDWYIMVDGRDCYDFYISPAPKRKDVSFFHISDTEVGVGGVECSDFSDFILNKVSEYTPDFLIHTGDICRKYGLENHYKEISSEKLGIPVRYALGNHDYVNEVYGEYTYEKYYGPVWYSFDLGEVHFAVLPILHGECASGYEKEDSYVWLKNDIAAMDKSKKLFVFRHDLCEDGFELNISGDTFDLRKNGLIGWQFGHLHNHFAYNDAGVSVICTARPDVGGIDQSPAALRHTRISHLYDIETSIIYNEKNIQPSLDAPLWSRSFDGGVLFADPVLYSDKILIPITDDSLPSSAGILILNAFSGDEEYFLQTETSVKNSIAVADGITYAEDCTGNVYAFDIEKRELLWEKKLPIPAVSYTAKGVLLCDFGLVAGSERKLFVLDTKDGKILSEAEPYDYAVSSTAGYVVVGDKILAGIHWRGLCCYDINDLSKLWQTKTVIDSTATPLVIDGVIYATSRGVIYKIKLCDGELISQKSYEGIYGFDSVGAPLYHNGYLYYPSSTSGVLKIDPESLEILANYPSGAALVPVSTYANHSANAVMHTPIIRGGYLIFAGADGFVHVYDEESGAEVKSLNVCAPIYTAPVVFGDKLAVADLYGNIKAFCIPEFLKE